MFRWVVIVEFVASEITVLRLIHQILDMLDENY
jgi:hypothetical protein